MRKLLYLATGIVLTAMAVTFVGKSNTSATDATGTVQSRMSIDELHRRADMRSLPAAEMVAEPF